jgi:hypothetical protein
MGDGGQVTLRAQPRALTIEPGRTLSNQAAFPAIRHRGIEIARLRRCDMNATTVEWIRKRNVFDE